LTITSSPSAQSTTSPSSFGSGTYQTEPSASVTTLPSVAPLKYSPWPIPPRVLSPRCAYSFCPAVVPTCRARTLCVFAASALISVRRS